MRSAFHVCALELRRRLRDRSALVIAFGAPVALAVIISAAFGGGDEEFHVDVAIADDDGGRLAEAYREQVLAGAAADGILTVSDVEDADALDDAVAAGYVDGGVVLPAGLDEAWVTTGETEITIVRGADAAAAGDMLTALTEQFLAEADRDGERLLGLVDEDPGGRGLDAASYFGPSMAIFFAFFILGAAPRNLLADRADGRLARLYAAPVPRWAAGVGITAAAAILAGASVTVVWLVSTLGFGADWGDPLAVAVLVAVSVCAIGALTAVVSAVASTPQQSSNYVSVAAFSLGLLGGHFFSLHQLPPGLQTLAAVTPNGQALRAFGDLSADGAGLAEIWSSVAGIGAFALATGAVAGVALSRRLTR